MVGIYVSELCHFDHRRFHLTVSSSYCHVLLMNVFDTSH